MSNTIEVPSPAELDEIDRRESQAIESLEISNDSVKCQKCSIALPLLETSSTVAKPKTSRMAELERRIKWNEDHFDDHGHAASSNKKANAELEPMRQELAQLEEEAAKADKLRRLPLRSGAITGYRYVCPKCYDKFYEHRHTARKRLFKSVSHSPYL